MRFDELILPEHEYPRRVCESRGEWLLFYSRGVPVERIAAWCRADTATVRRVIRREATRNPGWFARRWFVHDQPALPSDRRRGRRSWDQVWWEHYTDLVAYVEAHGGLPAQNDSTVARVLYRWIENQRRVFDAGKLVAEKIAALDRVGEWVGTRKGNPEELWARRLEELRLFRAERGRFPRHEKARYPEEKVLAVWLGRQRTWHRKGRLRPDRLQLLEEVVSGWNETILGRARSVEQ
ncbi:helicase associated domain-containing protein [uncultured Arthrobacter sp.]|uniref:helicase associated domain-containing protein n=1 Tax=uncultured Arthrobacter sp. TaxID=114050 RepID=UPI00261B8878|nr:helicase associated domain-containing protein [uncultured Arthrobacter sp.]